MNFQIGVACLLDKFYIHHQFMHMLGHKVVVGYSFLFECVKSEYNVGPCSRTHDLKCSNTTQGMVEVFVILNWSMEE